jgi:hypothetical protein
MVTYQPVSEERMALERILTHFACGRVYMQEAIDQIIAARPKPEAVYQYTAGSLIHDYGA